VSNSRSARVASGTVAANDDAGASSDDDDDDDDDDGVSFGVAGTSVDGGTWVERNAIDKSQSDTSKRASNAVTSRAIMRACQKSGEKKRANGNV